MQYALRLSVHLSSIPCGFGDGEWEDMAETNRYHRSLLAELENSIIE